MKYSRLYILSISLTFSSVLFGQQELADSLAQILPDSKGISKVDLFSRLSDVYQYINTKKSIEYAYLGINLADSLGYKKGLAACYGSLGFANINLDNDKAIKFTEKALDIRRKIHDNSGIATSLNVLGVIYYYSGDYILSVEYHSQAINIREKIGDEIKTATSYNNVALVYMALENYDTALEYLLKALEIRVNHGDRRGEAIIKTNIGNIYAGLGQDKKAFEYFFDALKINKEIGTLKSEADSHFSIANLYKKLNQKSKAFLYFYNAMNMYKRFEEKNGIANSENGIAELHFEQGNIDSALVHARNAFKYASEINSLENIVNSTDVLQKCYSTKGNFEKAYEYLSAYKFSIDSLKSDSKLKKLAKLELDYKLQKLSKEQDNKLHRQNLFIQFLVVILVFVAIIFVLVLRGLRIRRHTNRQLAQLNSKLQEANSTKDKFFSIIAHDLRGPFQTFLGLTNFLIENRDSISDEELTESLESMHSSLRNQFSLLNELLQWSELQSERFELEPELIVLRETVEDVCDALILTAVHKGIQINNKVEPDIMVTADQNMLRLVFRNLISNSIKFTRNDGEIIIAAEKNSDTVEVAVSDSGIGMDNTTLRNLFRIDVHNTQRGTANEKGTGLGLILCKEIVEKHGGLIYAESEPEKGSRFTFTLPIK